MRYILALMVVLGSFVAPAHASLIQNFQNQSLPQIGTTRLTWLVWDIYDAALYAPNGQYFANQPFVLELTYLRPLNANQVAATTISEMQRFGYTNLSQAAALKPKLVEYFSHIKTGTKLAAVHNANGSVTFIRNGSQVLGTITDPTFAKYFFGIWLSEQTLKPALRRQLLGLN